MHNVRKGNKKVHQILKLLNVISDNTSLTEGIKLTDQQLMSIAPEMRIEKIAERVPIEFTNFVLDRLQPNCHWASKV